MSKIEEIRDRLDKGYVMSLYGTRELLHEQMEDDISSLLILFDAQKRALEINIKEYEKTRNFLIKDKFFSLASNIDNRIIALKKFEHEIYKL